jgi:N-carbamoylputrescine amidase
MAAGRAGMTPTLTVATASVESSMADVPANLKKAVDIIGRAADQGAEVVVFPETYLTGYTCGEVDFKFFELAEPVPGPSTDVLVNEAAKRNIYVAIGLAEANQQHAGVIHNSAVFLGPEGILHVHRKVHLPEMPPCLKEVHSGFTPGNRFSVFTIKQNWTIGMAICRDSSFPETSRVMAIKGMDLLLTLSAGPSFTRERWHLINQVRAMDNDVYHVYSNVVGTQWGNVTFWGGGMIIGPDGKFLARGRVDEEDLVVATLEARHLIEVRQTHNFLRDRRPSAYQELSSTDFMPY